MSAVRGNEEIYDGLYNTGQYVGFDARVQKSLRLFPKCKTLLDIGCGDGKISKEIEKATEAKIYGVDISSVAVAKARKLGVLARKIDIGKARLPFKNDFFDAVWCGEVIEHVYDTDGLLDEIRRVLKKDGILVITAPNIAAWYNRWLLWAGKLPNWVESGSRNPVGTPYGVISGHVKAFTKDSLCELLKIHDFKIEEIHGIHMDMNDSVLDFAKLSGKRRIAARAFGKLDKFFSRKVSMANNVIVKARK